MASTSTNKQPVLVDRPLFDSVRVTTQTVGTVSTLFVQGGQAPSILVDMDAALTEDNNNGGVVDAINIVRNDSYREPDFTINSGTSGNVISISSGQILFVEDTSQVTATGTPMSGYGYYLYSGSTTLTGVNTALHITGGDPSGLSGGFTYTGVAFGQQDAVTFVFYHTRGTTTPIPASGDYKILFSKTVPLNTQQVNCNDVMLDIAYPMPNAGDSGSLTGGSPLRNKGIYLERGDRIYVGVVPNGPHASGYTPGVHVFAQGGFF